MSDEVAVVNTPSPLGLTTSGGTSTTTSTTATVTVTTTTSSGRPILPPKKPSSDDLLLVSAKRKRKSEKKASRMNNSNNQNNIPSENGATSKKPHRFTGRPRGFVRGKFKNIIQSFSEASLPTEGLMSDDEEDDAKTEEKAPATPDSEKDGPTDSPASTSGGVTPDEISSGEERPTRKKQHRRRFSTEGRLEGTFDVENIQTRVGRAGSIVTPLATGEYGGRADRGHRRHVSLHKREKEKRTPEEKEKRKLMKKLETDQESHPIAWAVGRFLFPFEIGFQVSASKAYPPAYTWLTRIDDVLLVGGIIFKKEVKNLVKYHNIGGVVNMCEEWKGPVKEYKKYGVEHLYLPTCDPVHVSFTNLIKGVEFIEMMAAAGRSCIVHCKAGRGRSSSVAICYYIKNQGMTAKEANEFLWEKREFTHKNLWKRAAIQEYEKEFRGKGVKQGEDKKEKGKEKETEKESETVLSPRGSGSSGRWKLPSEKEKAKSPSSGGSGITRKHERSKSNGGNLSEKDSSGSDKDKTHRKKVSKGKSGDHLTRAKSHHTEKAPDSPGHRRRASTNGRIERTSDNITRLRAPVKASSIDGMQHDVEDKEDKDRKKKMKERRKTTKEPKTPRGSGNSSGEKLETKTPKSPPENSDESRKSGSKKTPKTPRENGSVIEETVSKKPPKTPPENSGSSSDESQKSSSKKTPKTPQENGHRKEGSSSSSSSSEKEKEKRRRKRTLEADVVQEANGWLVDDREHVESDDGGKKHHKHKNSKEHKRKKSPIRMEVSGDKDVAEQEARGGSEKKEKRKEKEKAKEKEKEMEKEKEKEKKKGKTSSSEEERRAQSPIEDSTARREPEEEELSRSPPSIDAF